VKDLIKSLLILTSLAVGLGCYEGPYTIFENITNDDPISDNELDNKLDVPQMTATTDYYYIACGKLRRRPKTGTSWETIAVSGFVNTVAASGTDVYAGAIQSDGTGKLYRYSETSGLSEITLTDIDQILRLKNIDGSIISSCRYNSENYGLYNVVSSSNLIEDISEPITDFTANNYFTTISHIYNNSKTIIDPTSSTFNYVSIYYDPGESRYYVGTKNGVVLKSNNASPNSSGWTVCTTKTYTKNGKTQAVIFSYFERLDNDNLVVATRGAGFFTLAKNSFPDGLTRFDDTTKRELYEGAIEFIYNNGETTPLIFFCTMNAGLWHNSWNPGWSAIWTRD